MDLTAPFTLWILLGLGLWILELFTPALIAGSIGTAALVMSVVSGWIPNGSVQFFGFAVLSGVFVLLSRRLVPKPDPELQNPYYREQAVVVVEIPAGEMGRIAFHGTTWSARCDLDTALPVGSKVMLTGQEGNVFRVIPLNALKA